MNLIRSKFFVSYQEHVCRFITGSFPGSTIVDGPELQCAREAMQVTHRNRVTIKNGHREQSEPGSIYEVATGMSGSSLVPSLGPRR